MISTKLASIITLAAFLAGSLLAPPVQQAIAAVIATDVQCTGCVGTSDIAGNAITAAKIKDNSITAADLAIDSVGSSEIKPNSVGAVELQGVSKLIFGQCSATIDIQVPTHGGLGGIACNVQGSAQGDTAIATLNGSLNTCLTVTKVIPGVDKVFIDIMNTCENSQTLGTMQFGVLVYHN